MFFIPDIFIILRERELNHVLLNTFSNERKWNIHVYKLRYMPFRLNRDHLGFTTSVYVGQYWD